MRFLLIVVLLGTLAACGLAADTKARRDPVTPARTPSSSATVAPADANVFLTITNQSFIEENAEITVEIDGRRIVSGKFPVGSQHYFFGYALDLPAGSHTLTASGPKASTRHTFEVPASGVRYGVLQYWYYEDEGPRLDWNYGSERPVFG